jgi:hypothetical protein
LAAEAFAFQSKNHPVPSPTAWFVPNGGNGAVVFLVGLEVELAAELGLAVVLPAAAAVDTAKTATTTRNITVVGMPMAGIWHSLRKLVMMCF